MCCPLRERILQGARDRRGLPSEAESATAASPRKANAMPATTSYEPPLAWVQDMSYRYLEMMSPSSLAWPWSSATGQLPSTPAENKSSTAPLIVESSTAPLIIASSTAALIVAHAATASLLAGVSVWRENDSANTPARAHGHAVVAAVCKGALSDLAALSMAALLLGDDAMIFILIVESYIFLRRLLVRLVGCVVSMAAHIVFLLEDDDAARMAAGTHAPPAPPALQPIVPQVLTPLVPPLIAVNVPPPPVPPPIAVNVPPPPVPPPIAVNVPPPAPMPPPMPSNGGGPRNALLDAIKEGAKLKHVEASEPKGPLPAKSGGGGMSDDLVLTLVSALEKRRSLLHGEWDGA